jgi:hypothetical protein
MEPHSDTVADRSTSAAPFYGVIPGHASRSGMIEFEIPKAATPGVSLLYRPGDGSQRALASLRLP